MRMLRREMVNSSHPLTTPKTNNNPNATTDLSSQCLQKCRSDSADFVAHPTPHASLAARYHPPQAEKHGRQNHELTFGVDKRVERPNKPELKHSRESLWSLKRKLDLMTKPDPGVRTSCCLAIARINVVHCPLLSVLFAGFCRC